MSVSKRAMTVVLMLVLFVLPASAQEVTPQLNFSHACDLGTGELEIHFVLVQSPNVDYTGTFVTWSASFDGGPVTTGASLYDGRTGGTVHYRVNVPVASSVQVFSAGLVVGFTTYQLANPGVFDVMSCIPASIVIDDFSAYCEPGGVRLEWGVSTELFITRYAVTRNGDAFLDVPADCPGCTAPASYVRNVATATPNGAYMLTAYNGDGLIDMEEATLAGCDVPTAVSLSRFSAK